MKYLFFLSILFLTACSSRNNLDELNQQVAQNNSDSTQMQKILIENLRITYKEPVEPKNYPITIIPIILEEKYYEKGISNYNYSNILFYNHTTQENNFLLKDSIDIITSMKYFEKPPLKKAEINEYSEQPLRYGTFGEEAYKHVFYEIKPWKTKKELEEITNNQSYSYSKLKRGYEETGPSVLYISDFKGNQLTPLTPADARLISWRILYNSNIILAEILLDSNKDKIYNQKDNKQLLRIDLTEAGIGQALLSQEEENTIKTNLLRGKEGY